MSPKDERTYPYSLEARLRERADELETVHMIAAIDAGLTDANGGNPIISSHTDQKTTSNVIFDDYTNPNSVANCLSPFEPSSADRIEAFCQWVDLKPTDVLLDIGCGDGRVCIAASRMTGCKSIGLDVSPPCVEMAKEVANEEGLQELCQFFQVDVTIDPSILLNEETCPIASLLENVSVVFLYTYPTLLKQVTPLLRRLCSLESLRAIVTLRYHLPDVIEADQEDTIQELRWYTCVTEEQRWFRDAVRASSRSLKNLEEEVEMEC